MWGNEPSIHPVGQFVAAGDVIVAETDEAVLGLDSATGQVRWSRPPGLGSSVTTWRSSRVIAGRVVACGEDDAGVGALVVVDRPAA